MPRIDGWTILKKLKSGEKYKNIPIVIVSVLNEKRYAKELKADWYLPKPTDIDQLKKIVESIPIENRKGTILVVDDDKNNIDILTNFITQKFYKIDFAKI